MTDLRYFTIMYAIVDGYPVTKEDVMENDLFWSIGIRGIEHWGIDLKRLIGKYHD